MSVDELANTAQAMVAPGKGILAADESFGTIEKRFQNVGIESTEENRRAYRELLLTTPGIEEFISGVILFDETLRQQTSDGTPFPEALRNKGIVPGIKVDKGAKALAGAPGEKVTEGLDGLRERLQEYHDLGARFAKWRAVIAIGEGLPTAQCVGASAHALARYAALCQEGGLVPIIEPEVLIDGDHTLERCEEVTEWTLRSVFQALAAEHGMLEHTILKASMVIAGKGCSRQSAVQEVAEATLRCLKRTVPPALPGVVFLSGGQTDTQATAHLNAMNAAGGPLPWELSFSYARALQDAPMKIWKGEPANVEAAQKAFYHRCKCNGAARQGRYDESMERAA